MVKVNVLVFVFVSISKFPYTFKVSLKYYYWKVIKET